MTFTEPSEWEGRILQVTWNDSPTPPPREQVLQASGICFTDDGQIVLVGDGAHWSLPGGHPESAETVEAAFGREVREEACAIVERCHYLGAQQVDDPARNLPYYQTRWWARVRLLPFDPQYEIRARCLISPQSLVATLNWQTVKIAQALLDAALQAKAEHC